MEEIFGSDGILKKTLNGYEYREEQERMAGFILERFYSGENGMVEAGTGTGKTLAYLIPAIRYAIDNDRKVAVTTETRALQKQLLDKDIPLVRKIFREQFGEEVSCSLCLGSGNYPCRRRLEGVVKAGRLMKKDMPAVESIQALFRMKKPFSRFDVRVREGLWREICREPDACSAYRCPFFSSCAYQLARREWSESRVLVMNHYLFFTNIAMDRTYLPQTDIVIFDEAHSAADIAASQLGFNLSHDRLMEIISRFYRERKRGGLLDSISSGSARKRAVELARDIIREAGNFFEKVRDMFDRDALQLRVRQPLSTGSEMISAMEEFMLIMSDAEEDFNGDELLKMDFDIARGRLFMFMENIKLFVHQGNDNYVYWAERQADAVLGDVRLRGQPVEVSGIMSREVNGSYESVLYVSATLAVGGDFSFMEQRLGIDRHECISLASSFDHKSQVVLYASGDTGDPNGGAYIEASARQSEEIIRQCGGNCLLLFTSYRMLTRVREILEERIDLPLYSQDMMPASEAVERYLGDSNAVLMGTHSFWQGIDLPGDLVRCVIMMRLPFSVPDSPPVQARMERLRMQGKNPFAAYQVPEAVIRFRQGFGRLIRSRSDRGIVAVLDPRLRTKPYGRIFLKSIPGCRVAGSLEELGRAYADLMEGA